MDILNAKITAGVADALRRMREYPFTWKNTITHVSTTHRGAALRVASMYVFKIGSREVEQSVVRRLAAFMDSWPQFFADVEDGAKLSSEGMKLWLDGKGSVYVFESSEAVDARYKKDRDDGRRKYQLKRNKTYPHCYLMPSIDMLITADNYIEASLAMHGFGTTGEPALQIPTPQRPEWWLEPQYMPMHKLLAGRPGAQVTYTNSRGEPGRLLIQTAAAFDGLNDRIQALAAELTELGLPVPK